MIPKTIHYCWFGGKELPKSARKYMRTWAKHLPDYKVVEWNESNFDINMLPFTREAYAQKKYAFVSDYVRLYALYHHGGIYFDTDVEVLKSFDDLLDAPGFIGYDSDDCLGTAVMAAEAGNKLIGQFLEHYQQRHFDDKNIIPNTKVLSKILREHGVVLDNTFCNVDNALYLYPIDYFIVKTFEDFRMHQTENSYSIHHYEASWFSLFGRLRLKVLKNIGQNGRDTYHTIAHFLKGH